MCCFEGFFVLLWLFNHTQFWPINFTVLHNQSRANILFHHFHSAILNEQTIVCLHSLIYAVYSSDFLYWLGYTASAPKSSFTSLQVKIRQYVVDGSLQEYVPMQQFCPEVMQGETIESLLIMPSFWGLTLRKLWTEQKVWARLMIEASAICKCKTLKVLYQTRAFSSLHDH